MPNGHAPAAAEPACDMPPSQGGKQICAAVSPWEPGSGLDPGAAAPICNGHGEPPKLPPEDASLRSDSGQRGSVVKQEAKTDGSPESRGEDHVGAANGVMSDSGLEKREGNEPSREPEDLKVESEDR